MSKEGENEIFNRTEDLQEVPSSIVILEDSEGRESMTSQTSLTLAGLSFPDSSRPWIPAEGQSFYYEENKSLEIAFATARASSFSQEAWRLRQVSF